MLKILIDPRGEAAGKRYLDGALVLGFLRSEGSPPCRATALYADADRGRRHIAGSRRPDAQHRDQQPVAVPQRPAAARSVNLGLGTSQKRSCQIEQCYGRDKPRSIVARWRR